MFFLIVKLLYNNFKLTEVSNMKKGNLFLVLLSTAFLLGACTNSSQGQNNNNGAEQGNNNNNNGGNETTTGKIKEIALKANARTTLSATEKIGTVSLFEIKANKGQTLKTADKRVVITSSDPEVLKVENTGATVSTYLDALKPGTVKLTIQSQVQEDANLEIDMTVLDSVFDRQAQDGFFGNSWDNCDFTHEVDETDPYIKTIAEDGINHQFYFRDSYAAKSYVECDFTFYSELDGNAHMPKIGFVFSTCEENNTNMPSVSFIYFDTDCRNNNTTFHGVGYNEIANGIWGWDQGGNNPLAKSCGIYRDETGVKVGETFKMGVVKDGFNYHVYFNGQYVKSVEASKDGFSVDNTLAEAAPTNCGLFDFKSEIKYSNYLFTTDETVINSKIPASPDYTGSSNY